MKHRKALLAIIGVAAVAIVGWLIYRAYVSPTKGVIKIGGILPLTGNLSVLGVPEKHGIELGVEQSNEEFRNSGIPLRLEAIFEDTQGDPKNAVSIAQKLLLQGVDIIIVSTTGASRAVVPVAVASNVPVITLCMDPTIQKDSRLVFRLYESMGQEAETLVSYFEDLDLEERATARVGVLYVNHAGAVQQLNDFLRPAFRRLKINLVFEEPYQLGQKDFRDLAAKAKLSKLTHLIIVGYGFEYPAIFRDFRSLGVNPQILGGWGFIAVDALPAKERDGIIVAAPRYLLHDTEMVRDFHQKFVSKYGKPPNFDAAFAYNAILMVARAIRQSYPDVRSERIAQELSQLRDFQSIFGHVTMVDGDLKVPMALAVWYNGKLVEYRSSIDLPNNKKGALP